MTKAASKQEGPKKFGVPDKKAVLLSGKKTAFLSGTPNFFGSSCFKAALAQGVGALGELLINYMFTFFHVYQLGRF